MSIKDKMRKLLTSSVLGSVQGGSKGKFLCRCGNAQCHGLQQCNYCGAKYDIRPDDMTLLEWIINQAKYHYREYPKIDKSTRYASEILRSHFGYPTRGYSDIIWKEIIDSLSTTQQKGK